MKIPKWINGHNKSDEMVAAWEDWQGEKESIYTKVICHSCGNSFGNHPWSGICRSEFTGKEIGTKFLYRPLANPAIAMPKYSWDMSWKWAS